MNKTLTAPASILQGFAGDAGGSFFENKLNKESE